MIPLPLSYITTNVFYGEALVFVGAMIYLVAKFFALFKNFFEKKTPENTLFNVIVFFPVRIRHFCKIQTLKKEKGKRKHCHED
jgi:hypothetical protein